MVNPKLTPLYLRILFFISLSNILLLISLFALALSHLCPLNILFLPA
jgi:hypothetical protein